MAGAADARAGGVVAGDGGGVRAVAVGADGARAPLAGVAKGGGGVGAVGGRELQRRAPGVGRVGARRQHCAAARGGRVGRRFPSEPRAAPQLRRLWHLREQQRHAVALRWCCGARRRRLREEDAPGEAAAVVRPPPARTGGRAVADSADPQRPQEAGRPPLQRRDGVEGVRVRERREAPPAAHRRAPRRRLGVRHTAQGRRERGGVALVAGPSTSIVRGGRRRCVGDAVLGGVRPIVGGERPLAAVAGRPRAADAAAGGVVAGDGGGVRAVAVGADGARAPLAEEADGRRVTRARRVGAQQRPAVGERAGAAPGRRLRRRRPRAVPQRHRRRGAERVEVRREAHIR